MNEHVPTLAELQCKRVLTQDAKTHVGWMSTPVWVPPVKPIIGDNLNPKAG